MMSNGGGYNNNGAPRRKWWKPQNEEDKKTFESFKSDVKTFLTISKVGVPVRKAYGEMADSMEGEIPYGKLGFKNFGEFLFHCDDILDVRTDGYNGYYLFLRGFADKETEHLRELVQGQSVSSKSKCFKARLSNTRSVPSDILLRVLCRPEMDVPKPPPSASYRGRRPNNGGGGRPRMNNGRSNFGSNRSYGNNNTKGRTLPPGLSKFVASSLSFEEEECDDLDEWDFSSPSDKKIKYEPWSEDEDDGEISFSVTKSVAPPSICNGAANNGSTSTSTDRPEVAHEVSQQTNSMESSIKKEPTPATVTETKASVNMQIPSLNVVKNEPLELPLPQNVKVPLLRNPRPAPSSASYVKPQPSVIATGVIINDSVKAPSAKAEKRGPYFLGPANLCNDIEYTAEIIGVDGFGFFYVHLQNPEIKKVYDQLREDINYFYAPEQTRKDLHLSPDHIVMGSLVIAKVGKQFFRVRIYERDSIGKACVVVSLEDASFVEVPFENLYKLEKEFADPPGQAVRCCLAGFDVHMMTDEIADSMEQTPLYPPNVKVRWVADSVTYRVPIVKMTIFGDKDVAELIRQYGHQHLPTLDSEEEGNGRQKTQQLVYQVLVKRSYFG